MKAAYLTPEQRIELREVDRPIPDANEVLVELSHVGICGSDLHYYEHGQNAGNVVESPLILGHESAGRVVEIGDDIESLAVGTEVAVEPGIPCGDCGYCLNDQYNLCPDVYFMGSPPNDGAFREYVTWPADYVYPIPPSLGTLEGAMCEPLSVGIHLTNRAGVSPGDCVLITGGGPVGLFTMAAVRAAGAETIALTDVVPEKLTLAKRRGADLTIDVSSEDVSEKVRTQVDERGVDVVIEASGNPSAIASTVDVVQPGGTVVFAGMPQQARLPTDVLGLIGSELDLKGSFRYRDTYPRALELFTNGTVTLDDFVSFVSPLNDLETALNRANKPASVKGVIRI